VCGDSRITGVPFDLPERHSGVVGAIR